MSPTPVPSPARVPRDPLPRLLGAAALLVSLVSLLFSMTGLAASQGRPDAGRGAGPQVTATPRPHALLRLNSHGKFPAAAIPTVASAKDARKLDGASAGSLRLSCPVSDAVDLGSWCLESSTYKVPSADVGQNDYLYAAQKCVAEGGWLPSAAQLIGAAPEVALKSVVGDSPATSADSEFPEARNGIKDEREMTGDLFTTSGGEAAAGSEGVSEGSKGVGSLGEPDPVPVPADPLPETLDYVTVFDNHDMGGFAGGEPVGKAENFRCAYAEGYQGKPKNVSSRS